MYRQFCAVVCFAACGRIDFDPLVDAAAGCTVGATEVCNGIDDNCDGVIDEGCPCAPFDLTLPSAQMIDAPGVAWTGSGYVVELVAGTSFSLVPIDANGGIGTTHPVVDVAMSETSERNTDVLAWTGTELVMVWTGPASPTSLWARRFDGSANAISDVIELATDVWGSTGHMRWTGSRLVALWRNIDGTPRVRELARDLTPLTDEIGIASSLNVYTLAIADHGYVIAAGQGTPPNDTPTSVYFDPVSGAASSYPLAIATCCDAVQIVRVGAGFGAVRSTTNAQPTTFQLLGPDGAPVSAALTLPSLEPVYFAGVTGAQDRYRFVEVTNNGTTLHAATLAIDGALTVVESPANLVSYNGSFTGNSVVSAAGRITTVLSYSSGMAITRVIQQCY